MSSSTIQAPAASPRRSILLFWLPTLAWLCVLASFSTDTFSAEHTGSILRKVIQFVYGEISEPHFQMIHFLVRKGAHFFSYGLLSAFAFFSWRATLPRLQRWAARWSALALFLTAIAGSLDEFHQSFVASRTPTPKDVLLDLTGAVFFQLAIMAFIRWRRLQNS